jgi:3'(2'), 5'-bisphosphate nucleotidase
MTPGSDYTGPSGDAALSRDVARAAGELLLDVRSSFGDLDPADRVRGRQLRDTADRAAHDLIAARLLAERPADHLLSEEGVEDLARLRADRVWIVDPLDGTWEYGQGRRDFAVHVALWTRTADGGVLSAATVDLPAAGTAYSVLDAVPALAAVPTDRPVRVVVSRSRRPEDLDGVVARLTARLEADGLGDHGVEVVEVGSVGAKAAELFAGRAEVYLHDRGFSDWDLAAPLGVALHRGLWCSAPDGSGFAFNLPSLVQPGVVMAIPALGHAVGEAVGLARPG